ncbi:glycosyltransferase [Lithospermum erythrorhizon]|uniref:Mannosyltransferase n=1 Tax=Lithospermum erythrorhizon TaxID=34254 RepID=A0AAV3RKL8_LITER
MVQTYFNPDEHWQALEVAHRITFGYGHLTWEWEKGIRSYLHPFIFAVLYKVLAFFSFDRIPWFMIRAPRVLQSVFAAVGDLYAYKLSHLLFGQHVSQWALFCQLTNWFMFFCITRTLSNSLETVLTIMSLYHWPCIRNSTKNSMRSRKWALVLAALACSIRPTSAIIWVYIGMLELILTDKRLKFILLEVVPIGALVLGFTFLLDRLMYGSWTFVPLNFLKFNLLSSGGDYYGTHVWHWYFTQGFTVMLFTLLPFVISGIVLSRQWKLSGVIAWVLLIYSVLGHKEFRFVLPVLPIALMFSGYSLATLRDSKWSKDSKKGSANSKAKWPAKLQWSVLFLLATNIPMATYMSMVHQRGTEDVMNYLSKEAANGNVRRILFLTPCHATPFYSTLHRELPMHFLNCTPSDEKGLLDESDRFMMEPVKFAIDYARNWSVPSHIVLFEPQEKFLKEFLASHNFQEICRFFHAHFKVDRDLQASVVVYALDG